MMVSKKSKRTFNDKLTLNEAIRNAKLSSMNKGYDMIVYLDEDGDYCITRYIKNYDYSKQIIRLAGFVKYEYNKFGCPIVNWYSADSYKQIDVDVCKAMAYYIKLNFRNK